MKCTNGAWRICRKKSLVQLHYKNTKNSSYRHTTYTLANYTKRLELGLDYVPHMKATCRYDFFL